MFYKILNAVTKLKNQDILKQRNELCLGLLLCNASFLMCISRESISNMLEKAPRSPIERRSDINRCLPTLKGILMYLKPFYKSLMLFLINQENQDTFQ